jgi:geranylgeranyl transferase type-1 subunit beta
MSSSSSSSIFLKDRHIRYFASALHSIPAPYAKLDSNRLTLVHFATHALDLLGVWEDPELLETLKLKPNSIIEWIYSLQLDDGGFEGGKYVGPITTSTSSNDNDNDDDDGVGAVLENNNNYHQGHIAMTYTALCTLQTLGDDLSRIKRKAILESLKKLQRQDGSFQCIQVPSEHDMRFLYCACAISYMLKDWSGMNVDLAVKYIQSCRSYDGAIALIPGQVSSRELECEGRLGFSMRTYLTVFLLSLSLFIGGSRRLHLLWSGRITVNGSP